MNTEMRNIKPNSMNTPDAIYFNFSYSALKLLGKNLYNSAANAISELVANAIDAKAQAVYVYIDMADKEHSTIEILDNGVGMDYADLAEKYVWIGRNKRDDIALSQKDRQMLMGRKGIGKLAALYLSNKYYILTKKNKDSGSGWIVDMLAYQDWEIPKLDRQKISINLANEKIWDSFETGTAIKLENVDLRRNGEKKIESLRRVFADFYLVDAINAKIFIAVKTEKDNEVVFKPVKKNIAYENFYAVFDNSGLEIASKMRKSIAFTWASQYEHIANEPRNTISLDSSKYETKGKYEYYNEEGKKIEKEYELVGWIAIHATIEQKNAVDSRFIRNSVYQPNRLRLYVRNKLAVSDLFAIWPSTQAMSNYIEGEISFNILDDDDLPDIATSSRQDFLDDERIKLLLSIVEPISKRLFSLRNKVGNQIKKEIKEYQDFLVASEKKKREEEVASRRKAEQQAKLAKEAQKEAEEETKKYRAQNAAIFSAITEDQESFSSKTHLVKTNALTIKNNVATLAKKIGISSYRELASISIASDRILSVLKYSAIAKFNIEDQYITEDLFLFCKEYLLNVLSRQYYTIKVTTEIKCECIKKFDPQDISLLLDNLMSNSQKSNSTEVNVKMMDGDKGYTIEFSDNGVGFNGVDTEQIFEFGFSNIGGTGIGLYNARKVVEDMGGQINAAENNPKGARFIITLR